MIAFLIFFWVIIGPVIGGIIGSSKNNTEGGVALGLLLGPIGWIAAFFIDNREQCKHCGTRLSGSFVKICPSCHREIPKKLETNAETSEIDRDFKSCSITEKRQDKFFVVYCPVKNCDQKFELPSLKPFTTICPSCQYSVTLMPNKWKYFHETILTYSDGHVIKYKTESIFLIFYTKIR